MLKKIMLSAVVLCSALSLAAAPKVKIDQSSKIRLIESIVRVVCTNDVEGFKALCVPGFADTMSEVMVIYIDRNMNISKFLDIIGEEIKKDCGVTSYEQILNDQATFRKAVTKCEDDSFIKLNGKWYFYQPIIDHTSKEMLATVYMLAVRYSDAITFFDVWVPEQRHKMIEEAGSKEKVIELFARKMSEDNLSEKLERVNFKDPVQRKKIVQLLESKNALVQVNGKWYIQFK